MLFYFNNVLFVITKIHKIFELCIDFIEKGIKKGLLPYAKIRKNITIKLIFKIALTRPIS